MEKVYNALSEALTEFCLKRGLEKRCAMELLYESDNDQDKEFLFKFIELWEAVDQF